MDHECRLQPLKGRQNCKTQLMTQLLSKVFRLFLDSIILLSDDGYVEAPDADSRFHDIDYLECRSVGTQ